jgi:hypothetical protein
LEGAFDFRLGDDTVRGEVGDFVVFVPRGTLHTFAAVSDGAARALFLYIPGAANLESYFADLLDQAQEGPADPERMRNLMAKWGMIAPPV